MRRVIIESPFAGDVERNKRYLRACIQDCLKRGESPYASHRMLTDALNDGDPEQREAGIDAGFTWAGVADAVVFYLDLGISRGMTLALRRHKAERREGIITLRMLGEDWESKC